MESGQGVHLESILLPFALLHKSFNLKIFENVHFWYRNNNTLPDLIWVQMEKFMWNVYNLTVWMLCYANILNLWNISGCCKSVIQFFECQIIINTFLHLHEKIQKNLFIFQSANGTYVFYALEDWGFILHLIRVRRIRWRLTEVFLLC